MKRYVLFTIVIIGVVMSAGCKQLDSAADATARQAGVDSNKANQVKEGVETVGEVVEVLDNAFSEMDIETERAIGESTMLQAYANPVMGPPIRIERDFNKSDPVALYLNKLSNAIGSNSSRPMIPYQVVIVKSDQVNALSGPGGYIMLTSGLVKQLQNEAQLAMVIGHEIAHITEKHALNDMKKSQLKEDIFKLAQKFGGKLGRDAFMGDIGLYSNMVSGMAEKAVGHSFSGEDELESDAVGMRYAMDAGYDPRQMIEMLKILKNKEKPAGQKATHPNIDERIAEAQKVIDKMVQEAAEAGEPIELDKLIVKTGRMEQLHNWIDNFDKSVWGPLERE